MGPFPLGNGKSSTGIPRELTLATYDMSGLI